MKYLISKQGFKSEIDDKFIYLRDLSWHTHKGKKHTYFCTHISTHKRDKNISTRYPKGKLIWKCTPITHLILGRPKKGFEVDHIDGNTFNNKINNLRFVTRSQNTQNKSVKRNSISGFKGVVWQKYHSYGKAGGYRAYICPKGKIIKLGYFKTAHQAALMYDFWANYFYGKFARTNFKVIAHSPDTVSAD